MPSSPSPMSSSSPVTRFFGGPPLWVLVRLAFLSLILGLIFSVLRIDPIDIVYWVHDLALRIYELGFDAFGDLVRYFVLGAVIVFPVWLVLRALKLIGGRPETTRETTGDGAHHAAHHAAPAPRETQPPQ